MDRERRNLADIVPDKFHIAVSDNLFDEDVVIGSID